MTVRLSRRRKLEATVRPGMGAIGAWLELRGRAEETGQWPVLLGRADLLPTLAANLDDPRMPAPTDVLRRARTVDTDAWLVAQLAYLTEDHDYSRGKPATRARPRNLYTTYLDLSTGRPRDEIGLTVVTAKDGAEAAAQLGFGDWFADDAVHHGVPQPHIGVAMLQRWQARYGAELVALTGDELEMRVARPPRTRAEATALAREHLAFCPDEVSQNAGSLESLTELVWKAPVWHFWWD